MIHLVDQRSVVTPIPGDKSDSPCDPHLQLFHEIRWNIVKVGVTQLGLIDRDIGTGHQIHAAKRRAVTDTAKRLSWGKASVVEQLLNRLVAILAARAAIGAWFGDQQALFRRENLGEFLVVPGLFAPHQYVVLPVRQNARPMRAFVAQRRIIFAEAARDLTEQARQHGAFAALAGIRFIRDRTRSGHPR